MSGRAAEGRLQVLQIYRLLQYVHEGDKEQIEKMVNLGVENLINLTEPQDGTGVLHVAVSANNQDLVSFLLSHGAHPNIQDKKGRTPLMLAAEMGNDAIVVLLAQSHADLRLQDAEGKGLLFYCIYPTKRHARCLQVALKCRADANNVSAQGTHVFQLMCEKAQECTPLCLIMLDGGTDPNATNQKTGVTALMEAAKAGSLELVRAILKKGGNPNTLDGKRFTAVHYAAMGGFFEVIQVLSAYSADMGVINLEDCTALHYAAATGNANCCKFLAQRAELMPRRPDGGPPHFMIETYYNCSDIRRFDRDHPPEHPLMNDSGWYMEKPEKVYVNISYCVKSGDLESLDLAFSQGVPVDVQDQFYKTPLMVACSSGNYEVAQYLLSRGADVNVCDQFFWTPLHHAAHAGQVELVELMVEAGAVIDARALSGGTPLMRAIESSRPSCVDFLIKAGASVNAENKKEQNCLDIARAFSDSRIIDLVKDKMDSLPKSKETKGKGGKGQKPKPAKDKGSVAEGTVQAETSTATVGKTSQKDSKSIILQNTRITEGKTNTMDITFVPKTVWGKPPTTSQLMSKIERRKELLSLEVDFDDFMMPFSHNLQTTTLELAKTTD
ncbi:ankyrin repeat and EF-hand domain-containing protein 1-like isoform X1 [Lates japonicus]|uniref:Ankyrin repeat and EF-hand domain-containing protein 1-like isoform X1 n=1 Tax=Lates japonicus TaxID=270547 RepID=A0AAD3MT88_LATJO|nr:ankyrin repeat and EF-hand domain-containing protein 1-like isoform X1 [Lates japonicus]